MTFKHLFLVSLLLLCSGISFAQNDTIMELQEVIISDTQLRDFSATQSVYVLNDSVIKRNGASLTSVLGYNSVIYFKENGPGMVSSPSFRGTTAQQTAVVWNGININSQLNGQTDFNILNARDFDNVTVKAGGGSVVYGTSAIGGTVHLNTDLVFGDGISNELYVNYGSYDTFGANYSFKGGTKNFSSAVSISRNSSDNDFEYPNGNVKNENGQFYNTSYNAAFAYKLNDKNVLRLYSTAFDGQRHFSRTLTAPSRSMYEDFTTRNLLEWTGTYSRFTSTLKAAMLTEDYKYFTNHETDNYTSGEVKTYMGRYDLTYDISESIKVNSIIDYTVNLGEGSDIISTRREIASGSLLLKHTISQKLHYEAGVRKEITNAYKSPVLFSFGAGYIITPHYALKFNASRNFRIPTFNDLYWQGSGNPNLKPESSYQAEVGNEFTFKNVSLTVTGYYIKLRDMLRWVPVNNIWRPENVGRVNTYGLESILNWNKSFSTNIIGFTGTYAYTVSQEDGSTNQLIYVPFHKATASLVYSRKNLSAYYRHLYNGKVFFTSDNQSQIDAFNVSTIGAEYHFKLLKGLTAGVQVHNLWNAEYQNVHTRPMPGRNYNMYLNFKF